MNAARSSGWSYASADTLAATRATLRSSQTATNGRDATRSRGRRTVPAKVFAFRSGPEREC